MDLTKMTRAKAEKMVAATSDAETLKKLGDHRNKHVRAKAAHKAARCLAREVAVEAATERAAEVSS